MTSCSQHIVGHYSSPLCLLPLQTRRYKSSGAQAAWDAIVERIMNAGEHGAPLHLKIRAYHVDLSRGAVERPGLILEQIEPPSDDEVHIHIHSP